MNEDLIGTYYPKNQQDWRKWLGKNHKKKDAVWVIYHKKETKIPSVTHAQAVEEALCFGWIDSKRQALDDKSFRQFFCKRKPKGMWSKINKATVDRLIKSGKMKQAGLDAIEVAKKNGSWTMLDEVEELIPPAELAKALKRSKKASDAFNRLARSNKRIILINLLQAKKPETRSNRIKQIISGLLGK